MIKSATAVKTRFLNIYPKFVDCHNTSQCDVKQQTGEQLVLTDDIGTSSCGWRHLWENELLICVNSDLYLTLQSRIRVSITVIAKMFSITVRVTAVKFNMSLVEMKLPALPTVHVRQSLLMPSASWMFIRDKEVRFLFVVIGEGPDRLQYFNN